MRNMSEGPIFKHLYSYAIPLLLSTWFQMGYNAVDSMIVGKFIGKEALAAVGIASSIMNLVILGVSGLCMGSGILMSEFFGAKDNKSLRIQISTTFISGTAFCLIVTLLMFIFINSILSLLYVPNDILEMTKSYILIVFVGVPFTFIYNTLSTVLKSIGDSKTPLMFLMFTSLFNAVLDVILIGVFHLDLTCSAITTLIAQILSVILSLVYIYRHYPFICPLKDEWIIRKDFLIRTYKYGGMTALQQSVQPIGKLLIQSCVNSLGVDVIAAFNIVTRIDDFAFTPEQSISQSISTFIAQNKGAKKNERIEKGFFTGIGFEISYWILIGSVTALFHTPIISLFTDSSNNNIMNIASEYLSLMAIFYLWPALTNGVQGFFRGMGELKITVLGTFIQTSVRVIMTYLLAPHMGIKGIAISCMIGWSCMLLVDIPLYMIKRKKL